MNADDRPLSTLVAQGWEIVSYSSGHAPSSQTPVENVLLRRQKNHKILSVRPKIFGRGLVVREYDL
jgi:hypothetical protein